MNLYKRFLPYDDRVGAIPALAGAVGGKAGLQSKWTGTGLDAIGLGHWPKTRKLALINIRGECYFQA
jgi:hypothetical protein